MFKPINYETTVYCDQSEETLKEIMDDAVSRYLSSNPFVFPVDRQNLSIMLRTSEIESHARVLSISVQEKSFHILSKHTVFQLLPIGINRRDVRAMCICLENAISHINER